MRWRALVCALALGCAHAPRAPEIVTVEPTGQLATVELAFHAGSIDDPRDRAGLTALAADALVRTGTAALRDGLRAQGATLDVHVDREQTVFTARACAPFIEDVAQTLTALVVRMQLEPGAFEAARADARAGVGDADPDAGGREALIHVLFGARHPYAHAPAGRDEDLAAATIDEARGQLARVLGRGRLVVGVTGPVPPRLVDEISGALAALPPAGAPRTELPAPQPSKRVRVIERDVAATTIFLGHTWDLRRSDPDFVPLAVGIAALGAHRQFGGRLFRALRDERGLNYGGYAYAEHFAQEGASSFPAPHLGLRQQYFSLWVRPVAEENAQFALRAALAEVRAIARDGVTADELEHARAALAGATVLWTRTDARALAWRIDDAFYGTPDFLERERARLAQVTLEEVNAALRRHLRPDALRFAIVTAHGRAFAAGLRMPAHLPSYGADVSDASARRDLELATEPLPFESADVEVLGAAPPRP